MRTMTPLLWLGLAAVHHIVFVDAKTGPSIVEKITEPIVSRVGSEAVINCTVADDQISQYYVEWIFLGDELSSSQGNTYPISRDCRVVISPSDNVIDGQEKFIISCPKKGSNYVYSLRINMLSITDNGRYQCRINQEGTAALLDDMVANLTVLAPPKMIFSESDINKNTFLGSDVKIRCAAEGVPAPNVTWGSASGRPLPPNNRSVSRQIHRDTRRTIQQLTIYNVTKEDRGTYRCSADNNIRPPDDLYSRVLVTFPPTTLPVEPSYGSPTGETAKAMLWCQVDGHPRPTMSWHSLSKEESQAYREGTLKIDEAYLGRLNEAKSTDKKYKIEQKVMTVGSLSTMESMFYSLTILSVEAKDMVYYVCKAVNDHGVDWGLVELYEVNALFGGRSAALGHHLSPVVTLLSLALSVSLLRWL